MIFVPKEFHKEKLQIIRLLFIISEKDDFDYKQQQQQTQSPRRLHAQTRQRNHSTSSNFLQQKQSNNNLAIMHEQCDDAMINNMLNCSLDSSTSTITKNSNNNFFNETVFKNSGMTAATATTASLSCGTSDHAFHNYHQAIFNNTSPPIPSSTNTSHNVQQPPKSPGTSFRRLSSSNSFVEMNNDNQVRF